MTSTSERLEKYNQCFLRNDCDPAACEQGVQGEESYDFDTFTPGPEGEECFIENGRGKWVPHSPPGTLACEPYECNHGYMLRDLQCVPVSYMKHEHVNCYEGHGSVPVGPHKGLPLANVHDVQACEEACNSEAACSCFVFFSKYNQCFLNSGCQLRLCEEGVPEEESYLFDTYISEVQPEHEEWLRGYIQHVHLNCYTGHGGTALGPNDGLQEGVIYAEDCAKACFNTGCSCFVWDFNQCFLREECNLADCEEGVEGEEGYWFDTFTKGHEGAECPCEHGRGKWHATGIVECECYECDPGYMMTPDTYHCVPVDYNKNEHLNCYDGHGATSVGPDGGLQADVHDLQGCEKACNYADGCTCFVFFSKYNQCFLRSDCEWQQCEEGVQGEESYLFDTYIAQFQLNTRGLRGASRGADSRRQNHTETAAETTEVSSEEYAGGIGYEQHAHLNCYTDHGASPLGPNDGLQSGVNNAIDCGKACFSSGCSCFVFFWKYNQCFLRDECDLADCEQGVQGEESYEFDTFTPGPEGAECPCEHGRGKWIPYSPPGTLACECEECDPGYMTTDMVCVPVHYNKNEHLNCYAGHGATSCGQDGGLQADVHDVQGCEEACNYADGCNCFVFFSKYNQCFLKSNCKWQQCEVGVQGEESYLFDTYIKQ